MAALVIRGAGDVPGAACKLIGFVPTDSVVVLGLGPITPAARFDIGRDMLDSAQEVIERFRLHDVRSGILAIFTSNEPGLLPKVLGAYFADHGFEVLDIVVADGERATGGDGRSVPYLVEVGHGTREEFARSRGLDPDEPFVVGEEPEIREEH